MLKERTYQGIIIFLLLGFIAFFISSTKNYDDLLEVCDKNDELIEQQRNDYDEVIECWRESYSELQTKYGHLLVENRQLKEQLDSIVLPEYGYTEAEIYLLAQCVEAEAGEYEVAPVSQKYITQVILNRLQSSEFPNKIEEVIYQKVGSCPQFSVAYNGALDSTTPSPETLENVYEVIVHGTDMPEYVCYFYSAYVTENWVNTLNTYKTVEGSVFAYSTADKERFDE